MPTFTIKAGDTTPAISSVLRYDNGDPIDLTGAAVTFRMVPEGGTTPAVTGPGTVLEPETDGTVLYEWTDGDTAAPGAYVAEFRVAVGGRVLTAPNAGYLHVHIRPGAGTA